MVSFFGLTALWVSARFTGADDGKELPRLQALVDHALFRRLCRFVGCVALGVFMVVAWFGPDDGGARNPAPTWLYANFWVGIVPASLLLGPVWRRFNPLPALSAAVRTVSHVRARPYPTRWGYSPAAISLLAFLWLELVYDEAASPRAVGAFVLVYVVLNVLGGVVFGSSWFPKGDGFQVYSTLIARAAPLGRTSAGRLTLRNPLRRLASTDTSPALTPILVVVLGSTGFDGLSRTSWWGELIQGTTRSTYLLLGTVGLFGALLFVAVTYQVVILLTSRYTQASVSDVGRQYAHTIIPIAIGYTVAHYFSFVVFQGQVGWLLLNDPLAHGWNLLGLRGQTINYMLVSTTVISAVQISAIIVGHVIAVICAHDRSMALLTARTNKAGQYPMLMLMVLYTCAGIALLSGT